MQQVKKNLAFPLSQRIFLKYLSHKYSHHSLLKSFLRLKGKLFLLPGKRGVLYLRMFLGRFPKCGPQVWHSILLRYGKCLFETGIINCKKLKSLFFSEAILVLQLSGSFLDSSSSSSSFSCWLSFSSSSSSSSSKSIFVFGGGSVGSSFASSVLPEKGKKSCKFISVCKCKITSSNCYVKTS